MQLKPAQIDTLNALVKDLKPKSIDLWVDLTVGEPVCRMNLPQKDRYFYSENENTWIEWEK